MKRLKPAPAPSEGGGQLRAAGRLGSFFLLMLALTLFARGMAGAAMATVTVVHPTQAVVTETLSLTGTVESQQVQVLTLPEGVPVQTLLVTQGQRVTEGDGLVQLDLEALTQALTQAQGELAKLELELETLDQEETADDSGLTAAQTSYDRTREDANTAAQEQEKQLARAKKTLREAQDALSSAQTAQNALTDAQAALRETITQEQADLEALEQQLAEAEDPEIIQALQAQIAALTDQLATDQATLETYPQQIAEAQSAVEAAQDSLEAAEDALEDAQAAADSMETSNQRSIQDAKEALTAAQDDYADAQAAAQMQNEMNQADAQVLSVTLDQETALVTQLQALVEQEGLVTAPCTGTVRSLTALPGSPGGEVSLTAESEIHVLILEGNALSELEVGSVLTVSQGDQQAETQLAALYTDEAGQTTGTAYLTGTAWQDGGAEVSVILSSGAYDLTVPLEAYHQDNQGGFVYVLSEVETVLGLRYEVRRENVTLLAQDGTQAAVEGILTPESQIVQSSSRFVEAGAQVRIAA